MASNAYLNYLIPLLDDAQEIEDAHRQLRTGQPGRQWRLGALNRAAVVMCLSAWEAYVEELLLEAVTHLQPPGPANVSLWQSINADARAKVGRFNTPNVENVRRLFADTIGLPDVTVGWSWQNTTPAQAIQRLTAAISLRHQVAHGTNPRPTVQNQYSRQLPGFFRSLSLNTDRTVRGYLVGTLHTPSPWPH